MENKEQYYTELITRYFSGEATVKEVDELAGWVMADAANKTLFEEYCKTLQEINNLKADQWIDLDKEWKLMESRLPARKSNRAITNVLKIFNDSSLFINSHWTLRIAAVMILVAVPLFFIYLYLSKPEIITLAASDMIEKIRLTDETMVTLNRNTTLTYPARFRGNYREVKLTGEAFFNVSHKTDKPFIISSGNVRVKVLGTSFMINTRKSAGNVEVILVDGSIVIYYQDQHKNYKILSPGDKANISLSDKSITVTRNDDPNFMAWKTHLIIFLDEPLDKIVATLNRVYHANIRLEQENLLSCRLTATFDKQSLESVLQVISATLDLKIQSFNSEIVLSGNGCN